MAVVGLVAKKIGMTRLFEQNGDHIPVTVLKADPCVVLGHKTTEKHGYSSLVVGTGEISEKKLSRPMLGIFRKLESAPYAHIKEFRVEDKDLVEVGSEVGLSNLSENDFIDVRGRSVGKGFSGVMKRHNFGGLRASHGVSATHRSHGSTGGRQDPGKVFKNKKMAGHYGDVNVKIQNLKVVKIDREQGLLFVKGAIPGRKNNIVYVQRAVKKKA